MTGGATLKREMRVAFSRWAQPLWFRLAKWVIIVTLALLFWRHPSFWWWVLGLAALALTLHLIWRWKTKAWTQPWGGWDDVESAGKGTARLN
jgi:hypothetical protein